MVQQLHIMKIGKTGVIDGAIVSQIKNYEEMMPFNNKKEFDYDLFKSNMNKKGFKWYDSKKINDYAYNIGIEKIAAERSLYNYLYEEKEIGEVYKFSLLANYRFTMFMIITDTTIWAAIKQTATSLIPSNNGTEIYYFYKILTDDNRAYVKQMIKSVGEKDKLKTKVKYKEGITAKELIESAYKTARVTATEYTGKKGKGQLAYTYYRSGNQYVDVWATNEDEDLGVIWYGEMSTTMVKKSGENVDKNGSKTTKSVKELIQDILGQTSKKSKEFTNIKVATTNNDKGESRTNYTYKDVLTDSGASYFSQEIPSDTNPDLNKKVSKILGIIQVIGSVISVLSLALLGIKYMVGSVEEKSDYKKELPIYALGAIMVFAISNLLSVIYNWATKIS